MNKTVRHASALNARYLSFQEVAENFVTSKRYDAVVDSTNTLILGPRGCGKTTLLKILTPRAQFCYQKLQRSKKLLEFIAIYIPADIRWFTELETLISDLEVREAERVTAAVVTLNVKIAALETFSDLIELYVLENRDERRLQFSKELIDLWEIPRPITPTLPSVKLALRKKVRLIQNLVDDFSEKLISKEELQSGIKAIQSGKNIVDESLEAIALFEFSFDDVLGKAASSNMWAFCFDELELAPRWLFMKLYKMFRSISTQNILFKLTAAPIPEAIETDSLRVPTEHNDYNVVINWSSSAKATTDWARFSNKAIRNRALARRNVRISKAEVEKIFGPSDLIESIKLNQNLYKRLKRHILEVTTVDKWQDLFYGDRYERGSLMWACMKELALIDSGFLDYLDRKKVNPIDPVALNEKQCDRVHRKIKSLVLYRLSFLKEKRASDLSVAIRARKNNNMHFGYDTLLAISEGNPRNLMILADKVLERNLGRFQEKKIIPYGQQSEMYIEFALEMLGKYANTPAGNFQSGGTWYNLGDFLYRLGHVFSESMLLDKFVADPFSTFTVDDKVPEPYKKLVKVALSLGAIQHIRKRTKTARAIRKVDSESFRLSYFLYPIFGMPLRKEGDRSLSGILSSKLYQSRKRSTLNQLNLPYSYDELS